MKRLQTIAEETYLLYTFSTILKSGTNMLKIMTRFKSLEKTHLLMIGGLVVVAGIIIFLVATQHGPATCNNASFCG